jgi:P27 family predicted phage terminase small subunit
MKTAAMKLLEGNPGSRQIPIEPDVTSEAVPTPRVLHKAGLLNDADAGAYAVYCCKFAAWVRAADAVDKRVKETGNEVYMVAEIDESGRYCRSELVRVKEKAAMELLTAAIEVGLTPKSRAKIGLANQNRMKSKSPLGDKRAIG